MENQGVQSAESIDKTSSTENSNELTINLSDFDLKQGVPVSPLEFTHKKLSIDTYNELLAISSVRTRLFAASAILGLVWFVLQTLSPVLHSLLPARYSALDESLSILIFGLISIGVSVGVGTLLIQYRIQNRHLINPVSDVEIKRD